MPRAAGKPNYKREILFEVIQSKKPVGAVVWNQVAEEYKAKSEEEKIRNVVDIKRFWTVNMVRAMDIFELLTVIYTVVLCFMVCLV